MMTAPTTNATAGTFHGVGKECPWSGPPLLPESEVPRTATQQHAHQPIRERLRLIPAEGATTP